MSATHDTNVYSHTCVALRGRSSIMLAKITKLQELSQFLCWYRWSGN